MPSLDVMPISANHAGCMLLAGKTDVVFESVRNMKFTDIALVCKVKILMVIGYTWNQMNLSE
jgi:hypothetical protein